MLKRWLLRCLAAAGCLALAVCGLWWWFTHATPGQYGRFFDFIYRSNSRAFSHDPNRLLVETVSALPPGKALDVAMGEGRNAVYLATRGWDVTGFDVSQEALRQANARAGKAGVPIRALPGTSETFPYGREQWDLIVLSYAFAPIEDPGYVRRIRDSLKPGGMVVFEHYIRTPLAGNIAGMPERGQLPELFQDFEIRRHEETEARSDWQSRRRAPLARMVAVKTR